MLNYLDEVDIEDPSFAEIYDELPLWSAPFDRTKNSVQASSQRDFSQ